MHKIALFISFISASKQNVLISHYRMYGGFARTDILGTGAHRAARFYDIFSASDHALLNISPHEKFPQIRQNCILYLCRKIGKHYENGEFLF